MSGSSPAAVAEATGRGRAAGVETACEPDVGRVLAVLAGHIRPGGRVLELGTGVGVGTAWILSGLGPRADVTVTTIERDPRLGAVAGRPTGRASSTTGSGTRWGCCTSRAGSTSCSPTPRAWLPR